MLENDGAAYHAAVRGSGKWLSRSNLLRRKSVGELVLSKGGGTQLRPSLSAANLTLLGLGAMIGSGVFVLTGTAAALNAGPGIVVSFLLTGVTAILAALCYAEFAAMIPVTGSAYTYSAVSLGQIVAWFIGWDLILEYGLGAVTVAIGWSGYLVSLLHDLHINVPCRLTQAYGTLVSCAEGAPSRSFFNLPALVIVAAVTALAVRGISESAQANAVAVSVKVLVILTFVLTAVSHVHTSNWHPFFPPSLGGTRFGWSGVVAGAGMVFYAYIGFDAISTASQEAQNPQRDLPVAITGSVLICTLLYVLIAGITTGVVPYADLNVANPIGVAADRAGLGAVATFIKIGAIAGLSSVILVLLMAQSRIVFSLGRDGLLPPITHKLHPRFRTPYVSSIALGSAAGIAAAVVPLYAAASLLAIGTLLTFLVVAVGLLVMRWREPDLRRPFRTPAIYIVAPLAVLMTLYLMTHLGWAPWVRLFGWGAVGLIIYSCWGMHHSTFGRSSHDGR